MTIDYISQNGLPAPLGGFSVSITDNQGVPYPDSTGTYAPQTRTFPVDTSFEPYRREAFRHRSIPGQREAIQMTNIMGEGTVNTEGLWRREQREWNEGAGQMYLDHRQEDSSSRFYASKGIDVFNYPYQATLLPDVQQMVANTNTNTVSVACNGYIVMGSGTSSISVVYYSGLSGSTWTSNTMTYYVPSGAGYSAPTRFYDMTSGGGYVYISTDNGIWVASPGSTGTAGTLNDGKFHFFAGNDSNYSTTPYNMLSWANDQLIAGAGPRLYAFQPRSFFVSGQPNAGPIYGAAPSDSIASSQIASIFGYGSISGLTGLQVQTRIPHKFLYGQSVSISGTTTQWGSSVSGPSSTAAGATITVTTTGVPNGLAVGAKIQIQYNGSRGSARIVDNGAVSGINSSTSFTYYTTNANVISEFVAGTITGAVVSSTAGNSLDGTYAVLSVIDAYNFVIGISSVSASAYAIGGTAFTNVTSDLLFTHEDPSWVWSSATGGETQVYIGGYSNQNGYPGRGCVYRSDLLGSSTTSATNTATVSTSTVAQPWQLNPPIQALPMSPDEYPTCVASYLNYIFVGTNRGIRMAQTLSVYDPTATATGDLKSGPLIPNILTPLTYPVTAILGDGRFVWFAWNNYDASVGTTNLFSTGLGKLDLTTFINGDPLAPVYASDLMVGYNASSGYTYDPSSNTGKGLVNALTWNPVTNLPVITVGGLGMYQPYATNTSGRIVATKYVVSGTLTTSVFDYGIPDQKAPVYFEYGGQAQNNSAISATVICEPLETLSGQELTVPIFYSPTSLGQAAKEYALPSNPKSSQFQVVVVLSSGQKTSSNDSTPILYRWTLKSFPNVVSGTNISVVLQLFSVDVVDGVEVYIDPYDNFYWLESLRQAQNLVTYTEGPLSTSVAIIESLDWIPHKRRDNYENGYEGDCVVTLKTLGPYSYTKPST